MECRVISGDGHIDLRDLPHDIFTSSAPERLRDRVPHVEETNGERHWFAEGRDLTGDTLISRFASLTPPERGLSKHEDRMYEMGFFEGARHPANPEMRVRDQEMDGVDADVIYGILGIGEHVEDLEMRRFVLETYNTWAADFRRAAPQRLAPLAELPNYDPEAAAGELRRAAKLGLAGADIAVSSASCPSGTRDGTPSGRLQMSAICPCLSTPPAIRFGLPPTRGWLPSTVSSSVSPTPPCSSLPGQRCWPLSSCPGPSISRDEVRVGRVWRELDTLYTGSG